MARRKRGRPQPTWPDATRARAVSLYREKPAEEVSELTGVPVGTIRRWAKEARDRDDGGGPPPGVDPHNWAAEKEATAREQFALAREAMAEVRQLLAAGKYNEAQKTALTMAIAQDKSGVLEEAAAVTEKRHVALAHAQAELIVAVIRRTFADLGLPEHAARDVLRFYLEQAAEGGELNGPAPAAGAARAAVRAQLRREWEKELPRVEPIAALPPGEEPQPKRRRKREPEVIDGEAKPLPEEPDLQAEIHSNDDLWQRL